MIYKFGEYRWLENLKNGEMSFSCVGNFISIANNTNNIVQGDPLEGVFAR